MVNTDSSSVCISIPLEREALLEELRVFIAHLHSSGCGQVGVSLGWNADVPKSELGKVCQVGLDECEEHVCQLEATGKVVLGEGDVSVTAMGYELRLCHEGDMHLIGEGPLQESTRQHWAALSRLAYPRSI